MGFICNSFLLCIILLKFSLSFSEESYKRPILVVVLYDSLGNYYFDLNITKNLDKFGEEGVRVDYVRPVFPTKSEANIFSLSTGLYPSEHGVYQRNGYDSEFGKLDGKGYELYHYKSDILPIWILNEMNGGVSGCMAWPGCQFEYSNLTCTHKLILAEVESMDYKDRVNIAIDWLTNYGRPANLVLIYLPSPGFRSLMHGPQSDQAMSAVQFVDDLTEYIQSRLKRLDLYNDTNLIFLSDHGQVGVSRKDVINLKKLLPKGIYSYSAYGHSAIRQIVPKKGQENETYNALMVAALSTGQFSVYRASEVPDRWHCKNERRFGPILVTAHMNYAFEDLIGVATNYRDKYKVPLTPDSIYGIDGYDNKYPVMQSFFMAKGPYFKGNFVAKPFDILDLFGLFVVILDIPNPPKISGNIDNVIDMLEPPLIPELSITWWWFVWVTSIHMTLLCIWSIKTFFIRKDNSE